MKAQAISRYTRITPRKARQVADMIRRRKVDEALTILSFTRKKAAGVLTKVVKSALANANQGGRVDAEKFIVRAVEVEQGPQLKWARRWMPRAMGRASGLHHRTSHIKVVLSDEKSGKE